jgi:hypothetical protein
VCELLEVLRKNLKPSPKIALLFLPLPVGEVKGLRSQFLEPIFKVYAEIGEAGRGKFRFS